MTLKMVPYNANSCLVGTPLLRQITLLCVVRPEPLWDESLALFVVCIGHAQMNASFVRCVKMEKKLLFSEEI